jgi:hypothetical protein
MLGNPVAVEKVGFSDKSRKSGDRKCPGDSEKSFVELPDAIQFFQIPSERVFQQPLRFPPAISRDIFSKVAQFGEMSNSVGSITAGNCTFNGVSMPFPAHKRRKRSTEATAKPS